MSVNIFSLLRHNVGQRGSPYQAVSKFSPCISTYYRLEELKLSLALCRPLTKCFTGLKGPLPVVLKTWENPRTDVFFDFAKIN